MQGSGSGRGVKEKNKDVVAKEVVSPSVVDETMAKEKQSSLVNTAGLGSYPPLPTQGTTTAGNTPMESIRDISEQFVNTAYGFFLEKRVAYPVVANYFSSMDGLVAMLENGSWFIRNKPLILKKWHPDVNLLKEDVGTPLLLDSYTSDMCMQSWGRSSYAKAMIEVRADVELKDNIVVVMLKITREGYYTCNIRVEYEWKPPRCACCKVFGHVLEECPKNIGVGATKNLKKASQTPKGISVGQKMGFKCKQVFQHVSKKSSANICGKKKINSESTKEVSKPNHLG
ncbi:hypothetical protein Tco_1088243 [Tanacetum coccineum]